MKDTDTTETHTQARGRESGAAAADREQRARQFTSDNWAGMCPEALEALVRANADHAPAYGEDAYTAQASDLLREFFETDCEVFFTFNGTAANSMALATLCQSYHSVICHELAHIATDECGAPEFFSNGTKILTVEGDLGKVEPDAVEDTILRRTDIHYPKPRVLSLTEATELGTVYRLEELEALRALADRYDLKVHMDGARLGNALITLDAPPRRLTWEVGVDVLCLGGTKNGLPVGDAVVFFDRDLAYEFEYRCKQAGQLSSKMRFLSAPWIGLLDGGTYLRNARHANRHAALLADHVRTIPGVRVRFPREANSVFIDMPTSVTNGLRDRGWIFHTFIGEGGARFMCAWDTTEQDVMDLVSDMRELAEDSNG